MVGPGEPGQSTGIWAASIFGGAPKPIHGDAEDAIVSPQQDKIAFYHDDHGTDEVWVMGINGEDPKRLIRGEPREQLVSIHWSPDGKFVSFLRYHPREKGFDVSVERTTLDNPKAEVILSDPRLEDFHWSPRNTLIYALDEPPPNEKDSNLWEMPLDAATGLASGKGVKLTTWAGFTFQNISMTSDSTRLAFLRPRYQANLLLGEFEAGGKLKAPARVTSDEGQDVASAWTADSKAFFFTSDRNGNNDIFKQAVGQTSSEDFLLGPEMQQGPVLSPDGKSVLYWSFAKTAPGQAPPEKQLKRMPVEGGASDTVLTAGPTAQVRCSGVAGGPCVLGERDADSKRMTFTAFDPASPAQKSEFAHLDLHPSANTGWDISPDGKSLAAVGFDEKKQTLRVFEKGGASRDITIKGVVRVNQVAWLPGGSAFVVHGFSFRKSVIARVEMSGEAHELYGEDLFVGFPVVSPDGKKLVLSSGRLNSNVWVLEGF